jgi:hypothetical protein
MMAIIHTAIVTIVIKTECRDTKALNEFISHPPSVLLTIIEDDLLPNSYQNIEAKIRTRTAIFRF